MDTTCGRSRLDTCVSHTDRGDRPEAKISYPSGELMIIRTVFTGVMLLSLLVGASTNASSRETPYSQRSHHQSRTYERIQAEAGSMRVVVKFIDGSGVRASAKSFVLKPALTDQRRFSRHNISDNSRRSQIEAANSLIRSYGLSAAPLIADGEGDLSRQWKQAENYWKHEVAELAAYSQLILSDPKSDRRYVSLVRSLNALGIVEVAYLEPIAEIPEGVKTLSAPPPANNTCAAEPAPGNLGDLAPLQGYMHAPPSGTNATSAHKLPGGRGEDVRIIDIEGGAHPHADLPPLIMQIGNLYSMPGQDYALHGTKVLGVLGSKADGNGTIGMAPEASIGIRSIFNANQYGDWDTAILDTANTASHIYWAGKHSLNGVVLIELQRLGPVQNDACPCTNQKSCALTPLEFWPADFDAIQTAVGNGATVVEAAANGGRNLDHPIFEGAFDQATHDSGAIMVTGSKSNGVTPMCYVGSPNHGSRINLHSWGENVATTGSDKLFDGPGTCHDYTYFNGSSSASAIVAGVVASLQGMHRATFGKPAEPDYLRKLLVSTGTPQEAGTENLPIGTQPDLLKAVQEMVE